MKRRYKKKPEYMWIVYIIGIFALYFIFSNLKININLPFPNDSLSVVPDQVVYNSCNQVCSVNGFSKYYTFINTCKEGETKITYGYPNQAPLLTCCCYNEQTPPPTPSGTCTETDGGDDPTTPGTTTASDGVNRMDLCIDSTSLTEYWCLSDGGWQGGRHSCDPGQTCISSRSGGYCKTRVWNDGDTVMTGGGSGSTIGTQEGFAEIDLGDYGLATGGNCQLGAELSVNWNYANDKCAGIPGTEGMLWRFYDSAGLEYEKIDTTPTSWTVNLHPRGHILSWDGHTNWRSYANHHPGNLPECIINYDYTVRIYIYDCIN